MYAGKQGVTPLVHASAFNVLHAEIVEHTVRWHSGLAKHSVDAQRTAGAQGQDDAAAPATTEKNPSSTGTSGADLQALTVAAATAAGSTVQHSLEALGWACGRRLTERLLTRAAYRDVHGRQDAVRFVKQHLWPAAFGRELPRAHGAKDSDVAFRLADDKFPLLRHVDIEGCEAALLAQQRRARGAVSSGGIDDPTNADVVAAVGVGTRTSVSLPLHSVEKADDGATAPETAIGLGQPLLPLLPRGQDYLLWTQGLIGGCLEQLGFPRWSGREDISGPRSVLITTRLAPSGGKEAQWSVVFKGAPTYLDITPAGVRTA